MNLFPKLQKIVQEDAKIILGKEVDFDHIFHNREDMNPDIDFYRKRKDYYDHYGYSDVIFAIVKAFESKEERIPVFEQVVVDEFQDFNKLEVSLIELLEPVSKITPEQQHDANKLHEGEEVLKQVLIARHELAPVLQPGVGALDLPAAFV